MKKQIQQQLPSVRKLVDRNLNIDQSQKNDYYYNLGTINRRLLFLHDVYHMFQLRNKLKIIENEKNDKNVEVEDIPKLKKQDQSRILGDTFHKIIGDIIKQKKELSNQSGQITYADIYTTFFRLFKSSILLTITFFIIESLTRIAFSVLLYYLFGYVRSGQYTNAYIFGIISIVVLVIGIASRNNGFQDCAILTAKIKASVIYGLYKKLSGLSQYTVKSAEIGKIINLLSNDFNTIQLKGPTFLIAFSLPVGVVGVIVLLLTRIGWTGILCILVPITLLPLQILVSKFNGSIQERVNIEKDNRVKITTQIIEGIKFVKLYGWEIAFKKVIQQLREKQIHNLMIAGLGKSIERALGNSTAFIGAFTCFVVTYYINNQALSTVKILSILELMVYLKFIFHFSGTCIGFFYELNIIFRRIANILNIHNHQMLRISDFTKKPINENIPSSSSNDNFDVQIQVQSNIDQFQSYNVSLGQIRLYNFNGFYNHHNLVTPTLKNINLFMERGVLYGVGGKVGSGKSGLLGVLLGQIPYYSGFFQIKGSVSYVEQQPIIFSNTIQENIIFGLEFDQNQYDTALNASCLISDLKILENGDLTMVGEKGMTLSGGQKARLCLARALYADSDIYLLDDPLSAVDSKVAKIIFETAIKSVLKDKTVVLVTHQVNYLQLCDKIIILENGEIKQFDKPQNMKQELRDLITNVEEQKELFDDEEDWDDGINNQQDNLKDNLLNFKSSDQFLQKNSQISHQSSRQAKLQSQKKQSKVSVTLRSYIKYIFCNKINYILFPITILCFLCTQGCYIVYYRFISQYDKQTSSQDRIFANINDFWLLLGLVLFGYLSLSILKFWLLYTCNLYSNEAIHEKMIYSLLRSPMKYFDMTPSGQLISKFSNDIGILDGALTFTLIDCIEGPITSAVLLANIFQINYFFIIVGLVGVVIFMVIFFICKQCIIESKQLDLRMKSPMFNQLGEMMVGSIPIRIYGRQQYFMREFSLKVDRSTRGNLSFFLLTRVFGVYEGFVSSIILLIGFLIGIYNSNISTANLYMISVIFLTQINDYFQWFLRQIINMQSIMVSVQRSMQIIKLKSEAQLTTTYDQQIGIVENDQYLPTNQKWPRTPSFKIRNLTMRYRQQLPLVLKGLNIDIKGYQKVGIVGRTGAGKSSIVQTLLRITEPESQSIFQIDGCNVLKMGLNTLRHHVSVIPQTPFLFKGTIKLNLDPFETKTDEQLWKVLQQSGLKDFVRNLPLKLETNVSNTSQVFSVGQKQLLCLARALLRNNKILFLDQATSNVDMKTDEFIQTVLKEKFSNTTIISIAHRLNTIADYDKVIVLSRGKVKESGAPYQLIQKKQFFYEMVDNTGKNRQNIIKIAKQAYQKTKQAYQKTKVRKSSLKKKEKV